jgi:hypothetical protein
MGPRVRASLSGRDDHNVPVGTNHLSTPLHPDERVFAGTRCKYSGFLVSWIDVCGYSGALLFSYFGGSVVQNSRWSAFLSGLLAINMLAGG